IRSNEGSAVDIRLSSVKSHAPQAAARIGDRCDKAHAIGARCYRGVGFYAGGQTTRDGMLNVQAVYPRPGSVRVGHEIHKRSFIEHHGIDDLRILMSQLLEPRAGGSNS